MDDRSNRLTLGFVADNTRAMKTQRGARRTRYFNQAMNKLTLFLISAYAILTLGSHGASLRDEAESLLKVVAKSGEIEYTGYTNQQLIDQILAKIDFKPSDAGAVRDEGDFQLTVDEAKLLQGVKLTLCIEPIALVVANKSAEPQQRESAFRLLSYFNSEGKQRIDNMNIMNARILLAGMQGEGKMNPSEAKDYNQYKFCGLTSTQSKDWLYDPKGYGSVLMASNTKGEIWFMAPEPLFGNLIVAFKDFSVQSLPFVGIKEQIQLPRSLIEVGKEGASPNDRIAPAPEK